jgi:sulfide:quinone oxidoreductase
VETSAGAIANDGLVIACGGRFIKKLPGIEHAILPCEGIAPVERLREKVAALQSGTIALGFAGNPNEPVAMRGGPMFEFLFGLDTQLRREGRRDRIKLVFFNPMPKPGNRLGEKAVQRLMAEMQRRDIETHLGHKMAGFEADKVKTEGGEFPADIIVFMPGLTGNAWFDNTPLPRSPGGLIAADAHCRVAGMRARLCGGRRRQLPRPGLDAEAGAHGRPAGRHRRREPGGGTRRPPRRQEIQGRADVHRRQRSMPACWCEAHRSTSGLGAAGSA